jgi:hypothetical protein
LLNDYTEGEASQYKNIHVIALSKIPIHIMDQMSKNLVFVKKLKSLKELNMNFSLHSYNEVKICANDEKSFEHSLLTEGKKYQ